MNISKIKVGNRYMINYSFDGGAGSGSWGMSNIIGTIKEINAEFIRVIPINATNKRSVKVNNKSITKVESLN